MAVDESVQKNYTTICDYGKQVRFTLEPFKYPAPRQVCTGYSNNGAMPVWTIPPDARAGTFRGGEGG
jgi:hypothetical protein